MKMTTRSLIGSVAIGGISTLSLAFGSIDRAQAATITSLYNTGVDSSGAVLADGASDSHYTLVGSSAGPTPVARTVGFPVTSPWVSSAGSSAWIGPNTTSFIDAPGTYSYQTTFDLSSFIASTAVISGQWSADNSGVDILLNGNSLGFSAGGFGGFSSFSIAGNNPFLTSGLNTLAFFVQNDNDPNNPGSNPTGLRVEMSGTADAAAVPEPSDMLGTAIAFGAIVMLKRKLTKKTLG